MLLLSDKAALALYNSSNKNAHFVRKWAASPQVKWKDSDGEEDRGGKALKERDCER